MHERVTATTPRRERPTDAYTLAMAVVILMFIAALDAFNFFDRPNGGLRYTILIIPIAAVAIIRMRRPSFFVRRPSPSDLLLGCVFLFGFGGALVGAAFRGTQANSYPVFVPMALGLMHLLAVDGPTRDEVRRILDRLADVGLVYLAMAFVVSTGLLPGFLHFLKYRNASAAVVAMAFTAAFVQRRWGRIALLSVLYAVVFAGYPSATQVLMVFTVLLTLSLTTRRSGAGKTLVIGGLVALMIVGALANLGLSIRLTTSYFSDVNKSDSNAGRLDLWTSGVDRFLSSPVIGQAFTGDSITQRQRDEKALPFHNDYVLFLAEGGILGAGLLLAWIVATELTLLRRYRAFRDAGATAEADLTRVILVTLNCFFAAMAFNPVLEGVTRTATVFGLYGIAMSLGAPEGAGSEATAAEDERTEDHAVVG